MSASPRSVGVTGAAGGIGRALAARFAGAGARVALLDRDAQALDAICADLGPSCRSYVVDLRSPEDVADVFARIGTDVGPLDVLVNNAAIRSFSPLLELDVDLWQAHQDVNVRGALLCLQQAARQMIAGGVTGCIVNIASIAADRAIPNNTAYGVSKAAVLALTRYAAQELGPHGIRVVTVCPGPVQTPLTADAFAGDLRGRLLDRMAVQDIAMPNDVADVVEWIASPGARFVTGTTVYVDGGYTAS